ncbi:MAG: hypothetical protein HQK50_01800 [Oligoflexia bacterium]|nr:hypothetical protein [Oligoflexia bacterium]MBF0364271.1 hypothetical protein [Oligoflexia bacterium]
MNKKYCQKKSMKKVAKTIHPLLFFFIIIIAMGTLSPAYSFVGNIYVVPMKDKFLILLGDYHNLFSKATNDKQMHLFMNEVFRPLLSKARGLQILNEDITIKCHLESEFNNKSLAIEKTSDFSYDCTSTPFTMAITKDPDHTGFIVRTLSKSTAEQPLDMTTWMGIQLTSQLLKMEKDQFTYHSVDPRGVFTQLEIFDRIASCTEETVAPFTTQYFALETLSKALEQKITRPQDDRDLLKEVDATRRISLSKSRVFNFIMQRRQSDQEKRKYVKDNLIESDYLNNLLEVEVLLRSASASSPEVTMAVIGEAHAEKVLSALKHLGFFPSLSISCDEILKIKKTGTTKSYVPISPEAQFKCEQLMEETFKTLVSQLK